MLCSLIFQGDTDRLSKFKIRIEDPPRRKVSSKVSACLPKGNIWKLDTVSILEYVLTKPFEKWMLNNVYFKNMNGHAIKYFPSLT